MEGSTGALGGVENKALPGQLTMALVSVIVVVLSLFTTDVTTNALRTTGSRFVHVLPQTASSKDRTLKVEQDPTKPGALPLILSENERTGIEFGQSFFIFVDPATFTGEASLKHVFHKGQGCPWPLMGPGVFIHGDTNAMRVVMNTQTNPQTQVDVENIPVGKWFHVVLNCQKNGLEVQINGNLSNRLSFKGTLPQQNYEPIVLFSDAIQNIRADPITPVLPENFHIEKAQEGHLSNLIYTRYALSFSEIQRLMNTGPAKQVRLSLSMQAAISGGGKVGETPDYLSDTWWTE